MNDSKDSNGGNSGTSRINIYCRWIAIVAILISMLQGAFFALEKYWTIYSIAAVCLAILNIFFAVRFLVANSMPLLARVYLLYFAQLAFFVVNLIGLEPSFSPRLLEVAVVLTHAAILIAALLSGPDFLVRPRSFALTFTVALGVFLCEAVLPPPVHSLSENPVRSPEWSELVAPHPTLGMVYRPHSLLKTFYPDNPRNYFHPTDPRQIRWWLRVEQGGEAHLEYPTEKSDQLRIAIQKTPATAPYSIQLNMPHLKSKKGHRYTLEFRARADNPRTMFVGFTKAHEPWNGLGLYAKIELTPEWQNFQKDFVATENDENARINFDVGETPISVDVSSVQLYSQTDGENVEPDLPSSKYFVSYQFNSLGCRGRDFTIPKPAGTKRILLLGNSYTLGVGVYEEDTFASQLERLLNTKTGTAVFNETYEVINCGINGYGPLQERKFYEIFGQKYSPDLVLIVPTSQDVSPLEEVIGKRILFHTWARFRNYQPEPPLPSFSRSVVEIERLDDEVRKAGARLAVVLFRNDPDYSGSTYSGKLWNHLTEIITIGLQNTGIPILDLGKAVSDKRKAQELFVHPKFDSSPNEMAHAVAAQQIFNFVQNKNLLRNDHRN